MDYIIFYKNRENYIWFYDKTKNALGGNICIDKL